ncbi:MAG: alkaline phosphatase family protein [Pirellulaceae bacterium]|nr:alkaline phosphatase family protein [Pirellulaceae bacterium]
MSSKQLALFTFVDAFGWRIFQEHSFLADRLRTAQPLETILGYSCACDPTIITGQLPNVHGHFSFFCYDPDNSPFGTCRWLSLLPQTITKRGRVRRQISKLVQRMNGYTGYFQIYNVPFNRLPEFDYSEKRDIYQPGGLNNGTPTIFDYLRRNNVPFQLSDWRRNEQHNIADMRAQIRQGDIRYGYLYLAELDGVMHADGTQSPRVGEKIAWYDNQFRQLLDEAEEHYDEVRLYVFSDHGMADVTRNCDLVSEIDELGLVFGRDYAAMYDSTMGRFWFLNDSAEGRIRARLRELDYGRILTDDELSQWGADFADRRYGDAMFLLNPGALITPSFMNHTHVPGMHGYDPSHEDSVALFASTAAVDKPPQRLDDLYDLMKAEVDRCGGPRPEPLDETTAALSYATA